MRIWESERIRRRAREHTRTCACDRVCVHFPAFVLMYFLNGACSARNECATSPLDLGFLVKRGSWIQSSLRSFSSANISGFYVDSYFRACRRMPNDCILCFLSSVALRKPRWHSRLLCGWQVPRSTQDIHSSPPVLALKKRFTFLLKIMWKWL